MYSEWTSVPYVPDENFDFFAAKIDQAIKGKLPSKRLFLFGTPFEPDLAGINAITSLKIFSFFKNFNVTEE